MNKYELDYGNKIKEIKYAENEDEACDNSSYPNSTIIEVTNLGVVEDGE